MNDRLVMYHSQEWHELVAYTHQGYGWCTWSVDGMGIATMKFTRF